MLHNAHLYALLGNIAENRARITLGIGNETSLFVTRNIEAYWNEYLQYAYPDAYEHMWQGEPLTIAD